MAGQHCHAAHDPADPLIPFISAFFDLPPMNFASRLKIFLAAFAIVPAATLSAQTADVTKESFTPFYTAADAPHLENILPEPPALDSPRFFDDWSMYLWGKSIRETERGVQAVEDAHICASYS